MFVTTQNNEPQSCPQLPRVWRLVHGRGAPFKKKVEEKKGKYDQSEH
jgi:hypothetical protein